MSPMLSKKASAPKRVAEAERLAAEADSARQEGRLDDAVASYRDALSMAPLSRPLRAAFAESLLEHAEARSARRSGSSARIIPTPQPDSLEEVAAPRPAPVRTRRPPQAAPGFEAMDETESQRQKSKEAVRHLFEDAAPKRRETGPKPRMRESARRPVRKNKAMMLAALYGGMSLLVVGAAFGLISAWMKPAPLPTVATTPSLPAALTAGLDEATRLLTSGEPNRAVTRLEKLQKQFPDQEAVIESALARAQRAVGNRYLDGQDYAKAAEAFETATRTDPLNADNWIELGRSNREHGRRLQAKNPKNGREQFVRSITAYERALDLSKDNPAALVGLGQVYGFLNDRDNAVKKYERVVDTAPDSAEATIARQNLKQLTGKG